MWVIGMFVTSLLLLMCLVVCIRYLYKFVKIIMAFEDNHSSAIEDYYEVIDTLIATEEQLQRVINMPIFFENEELRKIIDEAKQSTVVSRLAVRRCVGMFIARSKQKEIAYEEINDEDEIYDAIEPRDRDKDQYESSLAVIEQTLEKKGVNTVFGRTS